ncbi:hypothetical protein VR46_10645 [Streptomyces sp. NRRL S-444]|nr:hypothetical protein VR46_10645 [Streptomyces sp. NRRL S-444]
MTPTPPFATAGGDGAFSSGGEGPARGLQPQFLQDGRLALGSVQEPGDDGRVEGGFGGGGEGPQRPPQGCLALHPEPHGFQLEDVAEG